VYTFTYVAYNVEPYKPTTEVLQSSILLYLVTKLLWIYYKFYADRKCKAEHISAIKYRSFKENLAIVQE